MSKKDKVKREKTLAEKLYKSLMTHPDVKQVKIPIKEKKEGTNYLVGWIVAQVKLSEAQESSWFKPKACSSRGKILKESISHVLRILADNEPHKVIDEATNEILEGME